MIQRKNQKAVTAVVATALIIVVAVVSVIGFQSWFGSFSSKTFVNVEQNSKQADSSSQIETLVGDELYFKNNLEENLSIKEIKVNGKVCNIPITNLSLGIESISLENCTDNLTTNVADIVIITDNKIFNKKIFVKDVVGINEDVFNNFDIKNFLVGYWSFDINANDLTTNVNHGTFSNDAYVSSLAKVGQGSLDLDGNLDLVSVTDDDNLDKNLKDSFSVATWVYLKSIHGTTDLFVSKVVADNFGYSLELLGGKPRFRISPSGSDSGISTDESAQPILNINQWYFLTGTYNSTHISIYLNGTYLISQAVTGNVFDGTANLKFGSYDYWGYYSNSRIDEVMIFNKSLSQEEITYLYNKGLNNESIYS